MGIKKLLISCLFSLALVTPAMAFCPGNNCGGSSQPGCGGDGYTGCTEAIIEQIGSGNTATITQENNNNNYAEINQMGCKNDASIQQIGWSNHNEAIINQTGSYNTADINQHFFADHNDAFINQNGFGNTATIDQYTDYNYASITQGMGGSVGNTATIKQGTGGFNGYYTANITQYGWYNTATITQK